MAQFKPDREDGIARKALVSCRLTERGAATLTLTASSLGITRARLMRIAIASYVENLPDYPKIKKSIGT